MPDDRTALRVMKAEADLEAARAALELERHDLQSERDWLERRIAEERERLERG